MLYDDINYGTIIIVSIYEEILFWWKACSSVHQKMLFLEQPITKQLLIN